MRVGRYRILDYGFSVDAPDGSWATRALEHMLAGFVSGPAGDQGDADAYALLPDASVLKNGDPALSGSSEEDAVSLLEWTVQEAAFRHARCLCVHAGCVSASGDILLLPGCSGSGKTTLSVAMHLRGWDLLSDELAPIEPGAAHPRPYPRTACIKDPDLGGLRELDTKRLLNRPEAIVTVNAVSCYRTPAIDPISLGGARVRWIVYPSHRADEVPELSETSPADALAKLIASTRNPGQFGQAGMDTLAEIVKQADCYDLRAGTVPEAIALLDRVTGASP
jgi:hypothetical protein